MNEQNLLHEMTELRTRVANLEKMRSEFDRSAKEQTARLNGSLEELKRQNHNLLESEAAYQRWNQTLQSILDNIGDGVAISDKEGKFLRLNPAARKMLHLQTEFECVPAPEWTVRYGLFLPDETTPYPTQDLPLSRAIRGEESSEVEVFVKNPHVPDGIWLSVTARPLRSETGTIHGGVAVFRDITTTKRAEKRLHEAERKYETLLNSTTQGVYSVDELGRCNYINRAALEMLGYKAEEFLGSIPHDLIHLRHDGKNWTPFPYEECPLSIVLKTGQSLRGENEVYRRRDGSLFYAECTFSPIPSPHGTIGAVIIFNDVSDRRAAERRSSTQLSVTQVLAEARTIGEAAPKILEAICKSTGWQVGALWSVETSAAGNVTEGTVPQKTRASFLRCVGTWSQSGVAADDFLAFTKKLTLKQRKDLPGRVWAAEKALWVADVVDEGNWPRSPLASRNGLHAGFAFPITFERKVTGVIEFYSKSILRPDDDLLSMVSALGSQIGQFLSRLRAEEELCVVRERSELALVGSKVGLWDWDLKKRHVYVSPQWKQMLGFSDHEIENAFGEWERRLHPEDAVRARETFQAFLDNRRPSYEAEFRLLHKDGTYRWIHSRAIALRDLEGCVHRVAGSHIDITERKKTEQRLSSLYAVSGILAEAETFHDAAPRILQALGEALGGDVGIIWRLRRNESRLRFFDVWTRPGIHAEELVQLSRSMEIEKGKELPGWVWAERHPLCSEHLSRDIVVGRTPAAIACGLTSAFAFPILSNREISGIVEFFASQLQPFDEALLQVLESLGNQLGQFISRRQAQADLKSSQEMFDLAVQGSGDGLWNWDVKTNEVYFSPRWKSMLGYEDHELANSYASWESLLHPDDHQRALQTLDTFMNGSENSYELEHRLRHKNGEYRWILARGVALRDGQGKVYRMAGSHTDVTGRREAEVKLRDSEALYHSLVETLPLNVFRKNLSGKFIFCNQRFLETSRRSLEEILDKTDYDFYPAELATKYQNDDRRVIETGEVFEDIEEHCKPNGEKIYVQVLKAPVRDSKGAVVGTQAIFWDVTARKNAEEALKQAKKAAEAASEAKSQFLANMSHEIRTPMNGILGMAELMLDTPLMEEQRDYVETIKKSADALLAVINDILDFSKIEAGKLDLDERPFCLPECLGDTMHALALRADKKGLELACHVVPEVPVELVGDALRLRQILLNLVGNAIKFTDQGEVVVEVFPEKIEPDHVDVHFTVCDTGIGIPAEKLQSIFEPFVQADGTMTRKYGGTGLGLTITTRLITLMHGKIWVESCVGVGSTFHFTARLGIHHGTTDFRLPIDAERVRGLPVLVVDDNATNRRILQETLLNWGLRPTLVPDGYTALEELRRASQSGEPFPLVLLDSQMPRMSGMMLAEEIKKHPDFAGAAVMMLTSGGQAGDIARCKELGINSYLTKPVKQADLWRSLLLALGSTVATPRKSPANLEQRAAQRQLRILLVEDNLVNQKLAVRLLEKRGHSVTVANHGKEALTCLGVAGERVAQATQAPASDQPPTSFDLVLMDVQMPEMDGLDATRRIREWEKNRRVRIPIVAMTAYAMKGDQERCIQAGMDDYITKPVKVEELYNTIERISTATINTTPLSGENPSMDTVVHWQTALEYVADDASLLKELIEIFVQECPTWLRELHDGVQRGDPELVKRPAHKFKGTLGNFGATAASDAALTLEMMGKETNLNGVHDALRVFETELNRTLPALQEWAQRQ